jgi:hypothetical protein
MCGIRGEGIGISLKLINYGPNISVMVLIETLRQLGMLSKEQLSNLTPDFYDIELRNSRKDLVGVVKPQFTLKKAP